MNNIEYSKWLNLGPFYLERGQLGVLDPELLPVNCDEYDFEYIEDFLNKKGAGNVGCQSTYMFLKQDNARVFAWSSPRGFQPSTHPVSFIY